MEKKIRNKFFFWAIVFFGTLGVTIPIILRILTKSDNVLILEEIVMNLSTYAVALTAASVYYTIMKEADSSLSFINILFDNIAIIIGAVVYLIVLNYLLSFEPWVVYISGLLAVLGCLFSWYYWFIVNKVEDFSTGALGNIKY